MTPLLWILLGYLLGSFPAGYLAAKIVKGVDIRTVGSGNVGSTNVGRLMGKKWAVAVTLADMIKGAAGLLVARSAGVTDPVILATTAFAGVCGHNFRAYHCHRYCGGNPASKYPHAIEQPSCYVTTCLEPQRFAARRLRASRWADAG